ncbi:uncharacterized protein [Cicer arietinum]|uniref:Uncharacterized protein LOC105851396 n=1 Tax=Cicer arietinum TaxID=3827 RepID=A0A1S3DXR8_CICAR|nr:uncharacterized protein LOC105851396 [Cicer arietinum]
MLRRQYELLLIEEDESVTAYFNSVKAITNQMRTNGEVMTEVVVIENIMRTLTQRYDHIVVAIEESKDLETLKVEDLQGSLEAHELRVRQMNDANTQTHILPAQVTKKNNQDDVKYKNEKGKSKWYKKQNSDEGTENSSNQNNSDNHNKKSNDKKKFNKKKIQGYNCRKWGHFADECRAKKVQRKEYEAQMTHADDSDSDDVILMATTNSDDECPELWYLDTSCSNHITWHKEWFVSIGERVKREIRFANNSSVTVEGVGKMLIKRRDGKQSFICDVLYVSNMNKNLLSLGLLLVKGYSMKMEHGEMKMFDSSRRLILKAPLSKNRTFKIETQILRTSA